MPKSKAIVKVARKLVNRLYFVLKHQTEYVNPDFFIKICIT